MGLHIRLAFWLASVALALNIPLSISAYIWLGLQKGHVGAFWQLVQTLLTLALLLAAAVHDAGVNAMVAAVYGAMLLSNVGSLVHALCRHVEMRPGLSISLPALREVLTKGGLMFAITIAGASTYVFDTLMALDWLGPNAAAQMAIATRICVTATGILGVIAVPFWPGFSDAIASADHQWQRRTLRNGTLAILALSLLGAALLVAFGTQALRWWLHRDLQIPPVLLWVTAAWIVIHTLPYMVGLLLNAALQLRCQIVILSIAIPVSFGLKFYAAQEFGVAGILSVTPFLWLVFVCPAYFLVAWHWMQSSSLLPVGKRFDG